MKLCMFHPVDRPLERGWPGRIDGEHVVQLAAQTLQAYFTGGGAAREHAVWPLAAVRLLAPVLHPPSVRVFESESAFAFANPAAVSGPGAEVRPPPGPREAVSDGSLELRARLAGVVGDAGSLAGVTVLAEWRDPLLEPPKDRDFALLLGPVVVTPDELDAAALEARVRVGGAEAARGGLDGFDWESARALAARGTRLLPGDLLATPALAAVAVPRASTVEVEVPSLGILTATTAGRA